MKLVIKVLKACADPNRMRILKMLQHREMCVCEITEALEVSQPSVSRHLKILEESDMIAHRRDGFWINYRLNETPSNSCAAAVLELVRSWLEEDSEIHGLIEKASRLDREFVCNKNHQRPGPGKRTHIPV